MLAPRVSELSTVFQFSASEMCPSKRFGAPKPLRQNPRKNTRKSQLTSNFLHESVNFGSIDFRMGFYPRHFGAPKHFTTGQSRLNSQR